MPNVKLYVNGKVIEQEVKDNANLVVLAGIRQLPELKFGCGMGRCTKCACKIIKGQKHLGEPNWKEKKMLGDKLEEGFRLACQMTIQHDIELSQEETVLVKRRREQEVKQG
ncbi:MAG: 2Fe-2S iron-sulfur cluster binding domain-containing protein [Bacillus sp. (in: firmicutes)]